MHRERSQAIFPAASNGEFNLPSDLAIVVERGEGCQLWDVDGRRFLDFSMGWGSVLVGHAATEVVEAVTHRAPLGSNFSCVNDEALRLGEEVARVCPVVEQLRFCASGTEATMYCQRLARAYTGRPRILKFEGAYHGANEVGVTSLFPRRRADYPTPDPSSAGIEELVRDSVLVAPFNDLDRTVAILREFRDETAAVIVEPLQRCISPEEGFLQGLREITRELDILLIFDEVVTGFRRARGGAPENYGVLPDLAAYGKALGGGYPIGVFGGRRNIVELVREDRADDSRYVWMAATLGGNPISSAAARAALGLLHRPGVYARLHEMGAKLREGMRRVLADSGQLAQVIGDGPLAQVVFTAGEVRDYRSTLNADRKKARVLMLDLFRRGIFLNPMGTKLYLSMAHDDAAREEFLEHFVAAVGVLS